MKALSKNSTVVRAKDQVSCDLAGEAVILNLKSGVYYGLNPVGAYIWELIQQPRTVDTLLEMVIEQYDVEADRCETDLLTLLAELAVTELIEIDGVANGASK